MGAVTPEAETVAAFFDRVGTASLKLPSGWFGRPHDNLHELTRLAADGNQLVLELDHRHHLTFEGSLLTEHEGDTLRITGFERATWSWLPWGKEAKVQDRHYSGGTVEFVG